jgi:hypothetical protein
MRLVASRCDRPGDSTKRAPKADSIIEIGSERIELAFERRR